MEYPNTPVGWYGDYAQKEVEDELNHFARKGIEIEMAYVQNYITEAEKSELYRQLHEQAKFARSFLEP